MSVMRQCGSTLAKQIQLINRPLILRKSVLLYPCTKLGQTGSNININSANSNDIITRGFKNFGHKSEKTPKVTKYFHLFVGAMFFAIVVDWKKLKKAIFPPVDAAQPKNNTKADLLADDDLATLENKQNIKKEPSDELEKDETKKDKPKKTIGFRDRKIIEYENRIRQYSTPDKVFRYFATIRIISLNEGIDKSYMTPDDFLRAITPGMKQPEGLGLDQYRRYDPKSVADQLHLNLQKGSIFYKLGSSGLITFSDYVFLLTVLSTSRRHFEVAFRMFDLNGDGDVDCDEFEKVATLVRHQSSMGSRHRDHANTGNTFKGVNSALTTYFFGSNLKKKLTIEKFLDFQKQLQQEILTLEFQRKLPNEEGKITEVDFANLMLAYAGYSQKKVIKKIKRVKKAFRENSKGISLKEYLDFYHFLNYINDVDTALTFYHIAGASIDQATLKHVAKTVAMVQLSDHIIDVVFTIFDENLDGQLSNKEFVSVMKNRLRRGLEKSKDTGFVKLMYSILKCANETKPVLLDL